MGEKKDKKDKKKDKSSEKSKNAGGLFESLGRQLDDIPQIQAAREAAERARDRLREVAKKNQRDTVEDTEADAQSAESHDEPGATFGESVEDVLGYVRRHPAQGVIAAGVLGFFFGRLFRRK
jgi:ElaB/YqjD/DUF883 family membrane-anchored ribosome-binding protein